MGLKPLAAPAVLAAYEEQFCQLIANGMTVNEALIETGVERTSPYYRKLANSPKVIARVQELVAQRLHAAGVTAERTKQEIARCAYADVRKIFNSDGTLKPIHEIDDDTAAAITSITITTQRDALRSTRECPIFVDVVKIKFASKMDALGLLAKHFKIVGEADDGVNALANALADRLNAAKRRVVNEAAEDIESRPVINTAPTELVEEIDEDKFFSVEDEEQLF